MLKQIQAYNTTGLYIGYCLVLMAITYLIQSFLITNSVLYSSYAEQLSYERIEEMIDGQNKWAWVSYAVLPLIYAIKFFLVACCLLVGSMFFDIRLKLNDAFKIALLADIIFVIPMLIKVFWFLFVQKSYVLQDIQAFSPLSALNLFNVKSINLIWLYPLQAISLFELGYIFLLGYLVYKFGAKSYEKGLNMVLGSYVPALIMWVILIMFVTLNLNPNA